MTTEQDNEQDKTTFRALLSGGFIGLDTFKLDTYGEGIEAIENGEQIPYRMLDTVNNDTDADAVGHRSLCGSDYNGGSLVRSNLKAFRALVEEETADGEALPIVDTFGGMGTDGVLLLLDREHETEKLRPFVELIQGLEDYPVVCEDTMSELEHEDENEAWENGAEADFARSLADLIGADSEVEDTDTGVTLRELFSAVADSANLNGGPGVIHEETGPYIMTDDAAKHVSPVLLFALDLVKLDADTMLDLASSVDPDDHAEARRIRRLSRLGAGLRQTQKALAYRFARLGRTTDATTGKVIRLSDEAERVREQEANRKASDIILRAEIDAGDTDAPIDSGLGLPLRIATVRLDRFVWTQGQHSLATAEIVLDPDNPYSVDHDELEAFLQD